MYKPYEYHRFQLLVHRQGFSECRRQDLKDSATGKESTNHETLSLLSPPPGVGGARVGTGWNRRRRRPSEQAEEPAPAEEALSLSLSRCVCLSLCLALSPSFPRIQAELESYWIVPSTSNFLVRSLSSAQETDGKKGVICHSHQSEGPEMPSRRKSMPGCHLFLPRHTVRCIAHLIDLLHNQNSEESDTHEALHFFLVGGSNTKAGQRSDAIAMLQREMDSWTAMV